MCGTSKLREALERLENPDAAVIHAIWQNFPRPIEVDNEDSDAIIRMLRAALMTTQRPAHEPR